MIRLNAQQINKKIEFIEDYLHAVNAADGSKMDANANVTIKNIATLESEINKDINIQINRALVFQKIKETFSESLAHEYVRQIEDHEIYVHDETSIKPYCVSVSMYPLLLDGLTKIGGESKAPKHLSSFCGIFINFVFAVSSQFAGAVATVEFLMYFDYFARLEFGENYLNTHEKEISAYLQQVIYSINQPAAARGYQSVFWNISIYDKFYFESLFENFIFPDGDKPNWKTVDKLQKFFLTWFNHERSKSVLTFPVVTVAMLTETDKPKDKAYQSFCAKELAQGNSFFIYLSDSADSLASCCRLRNEVSGKDFSYTLGAGGIATGSINVITLNMNRLIQDQRDLKAEIKKIQSYQIAYRKLIEEFKEARMLTVYEAGFISLDKQYLTIGINGMVEAAEYLGHNISDNEEYISFVSSQLKVIYDLNRERSEQTGYKFNTEFVPAENLGVKNAEWDLKDGYVVPRECYNSYFYKVEDESVNPLEKFVLHGHSVIKYLDGGSALHLNLEESLTQIQYEKLIELAAKTGCNYFCINVKITICNECHHIDKKTLLFCSQCGSEDVDYATRVIGYLKKISSFSHGRRKEHGLRSYHLWNRKLVESTHEKVLS
ncbi:MAG: anaerobic ribonucleoside-triphosphate reductase, partial [Bdellovibrionaceae bacterium]|nr:anaerobic ribonucleoside-triphosphate reductase [Pseudobdellovibrionaceae bacterium]NUM59698.1 anaerobic ribonucleoside-triphosphate reductase [Pseudobdellovibrionaceae bacterium]